MPMAPAHSIARSSFCNSMISFSWPTATPTTASSCAITSIRCATNSGNRFFLECEKSSVAELMRILTVLDLPSDPRLGAARIFMELSRAWETAGHKVSHYCLGDAFTAPTSSPPLSAWRRLRFPGRGAAFVRKNAARFDVIDCLVGALPVTKHRLNFTGLLVARSIGSHRLYRNFEEMARERWPDQPRGKLSGRIFYTFFQQLLFRNSEKKCRRSGPIVSLAAGPANARAPSLQNCDRGDESQSIARRVGR